MFWACSCDPHCQPQHISKLSLAINLSTVYLQTSQQADWGRSSNCDAMNVSSETSPPQDKLVETEVVCVASEGEPVEASRQH